MQFSTHKSKLHGSIRSLPNGSHWLRVQHAEFPLSKCYSTLEEAQETLVSHNLINLLLKNYSYISGSTAEMKLSCNKSMLVDVQSLPLFNEICVYARCDGNIWYAGCTIDRKTIQAHRLIYEKIVGPIPEGCVIDHIDGNGLNNQISNLRAVT